MNFDFKRKLSAKFQRVFRRMKSLPSLYRGELIFTAVMTLIVAAGVLVVGYHQSHFQESLSPEQLANYRRLVEEFKTASNGDLALAFDGKVYLIYGGHRGIKVIMKTPISGPEEVAPEFICRREIVRVMKKGEPDYNVYLAKYINQMHSRR